MSAKKETTPIHNSAPIVDFSSPLNLSYLSISTDLDRELVRSLALFGESDSFKDICKRNPVYNFLEPSVKTAARNRRRYLLKIQRQDPAKFEQLVCYYRISNHKSINLTSSFNRASDLFDTSVSSTLDDDNHLEFENNEKMSLAVHHKAKGKYIESRCCCCFILKSYLSFLSSFLLH